VEFLEEFLITDVSLLEFISASAEHLFTMGTDHKTRRHVENQFCHKRQSKQSMADQLSAYLVPVIA